MSQKAERISSSLYRAELAMIIYAKRIPLGKSGLLEHTRVLVSDCMTRRSKDWPRTARSWTVIGKFFFSFDLPFENLTIQERHWNYRKSFIEETLLVGEDVMEFRWVTVKRRSTTSVIASFDSDLMLYAQLLYFPILFCKNVIINLHSKVKDIDVYHKSY